MPVIPATWEAEISRIKFQSQHGQKFSKTLISTNKLGIVAYACDPSYTGSVGRRTVLAPSKNMRPYPKNN
jgi:hypothetical protein